MKLYDYVGPANIRARAAASPPGQRVGSADDFSLWVRQTGEKPNREGLVVVTFVVDAVGALRVADRGSEHVACAGGGPVLSAGEMFFLLTGDDWRVEEVSNQSTGFCPEPESWKEVGAALDRAGIPHPGRFTLEVILRRCPSCGERNVVKDGWFVCGVCGADLPLAWNFDEREERP